MIQKKILVIDDELDIRENIKRILTGAGYFVQTADNLRNAIKILVEQPSFDLITCDIMIPAAGGFELIDEIKSDKKYEHIPILMITGMDIDVLQATTHSADAVLMKPFSATELMNKVKTFM
jgi:CheY-like chemotaxis protein